VRRIWIAAVLVPGVILGCSRQPRRQSAALSPDEVALENRGVGLMGQFDYERAREAFARAAVGHPDRADLQTNLAIAILNRQRPDDDTEARRMLESVLAAHPEDLRAHYNLALLLLNDGNAREALAHFTFAAEHADTDAHAAYFVGQCRSQDGELDEALRWYERSLALNPRLRSAAYGAFRALQRLGRTAEAERMLAVFRDLEANPQSEVVEFKYTRMGRLAEAAAPDGPPRQRAPRPAGSVFERTMLPLTPAPASIVWRRFDAAHPASITAADIDGDGQIDLFIAGAIDDRGITRNAVLLNRGSAGFSLDLAHPLASVPGVNAALWGDYDNDGLTDVYLCRRGANELWRQTARGTWSNATAAARAEGGGGDTIDGAIFDADHDGDLDILLIRSDGASELLNNNGDGTFRPLGARIGLAGPGSTGVVVADLDADRDADIVVIKRTTPHQVLINDRTWQYHRATAFNRFVGTPISAAVAGDMDADGRVELYTSGSEGLTQWTRAASGSWEPHLISQTGSVANAPQLALADVDGDGRPDLVATDRDGRWRAFTVSPEGAATAVFVPGGPPIAGWALATLDAVHGPALVAMPAQSSGPPMMWQPGPGRFAYVTVEPSGQDPSGGRLRSNRSGIGTQIAARADSRWTALTNLRSQSGFGQSLQPLAIGTGGEPQLDFVAITWSDGVLQTELALAPGRVQRIEETERQLSSCPVLFAFDGQHFAFVTDLLGVGGMGTPTSPGVYDPPRARENVLLPEGLIQARPDPHGRFELKITEPMEEVAYLDSVRLVAYDIPPGWQMVLDERKAISSPEATGEPRFFRSERLPVQALDDEGRDVTRTIAAVDGVAAPPGVLDPRFIGLSADHSLRLRFDRPLDAEAGDPMLVADGWVEYPYAQTLFAAWQAGAEYRAPTVEARDAGGRWHTLLREFGYPAGMARRMSVPLGRIPQGTRELRLRTTQEIYWDRLSVAFASSCPLAARQVLPLSSARLKRSGYAVRDLHASRRPSYDYDRRVPLWDARYARGNYTTEGPVTELVSTADGALAVFGPGEEVHLEFDAPQNAPKPGWTRRFVLEARGWCKDMDLYTKAGDTVEPLPGSRAAAAEQLQRRYTTRYESGR
jgi:Tfp pilus assembly protein PilF